MSTPAGVLAEFASACCAVFLVFPSPAKSTVHAVLDRQNQQKSEQTCVIAVKMTHCRGLLTWIEDHQVLCVAKAQPSAQGRDRGQRIHQLMPG